MRQWYVVRTKTGHEERAQWHLNNQGFTTYVPRHYKQVRHARKTSTVMRPLFPGYIFVHLDLGRERWRSINGTVGVFSLVQFGSTPLPLPNEILDAIRMREDDNGVVSIAPVGLEKGDSVRIREGAFAEYMAIVDELSDEKRVVLLLDLMGREVRVKASVEDIAKAS